MFNQFANWLAHGNFSAFISVLCQSRRWPNLISFSLFSFCTCCRLSANNGFYKIKLISTKRCIDFYAYTHCRSLLVLCRNTRKIYKWIKINGRMRSQGVYQNQHSLGNTNALWLTHSQRYFVYGFGKQYILQIISQRKHRIGFNMARTVTQIFGFL